MSRSGLNNVIFHQPYLWTRFWRRTNSGSVQYFRNTWVEDFNPRVLLHLTGLRSVGSSLNNNRLLHFKAHIIENFQRWSQYVSFNIQQDFDVLIPSRRLTRQELFSMTELHTPITPSMAIHMIFLLHCPLKIFFVHSVSIALFHTSMSKLSSNSWIVCQVGGSSLSGAGTSSLAVSLSITLVSAFVRWCISLYLVTRRYPGTLDIRSRCWWVHQKWVRIATFGCQDLLLGCTQSCKSWLVSVDPSSKTP